MEVAKKQFNFLQFINFVDVSKWHIEQYLITQISSIFPLVSLGKILTPRKERENAAHIGNAVPLVEKIRFSDGKIFYRTEPLKNFVFLAHNGDLLVSNINFEKGAFAIVENDILACSTDYQPYKVSDTILGDFLNLVLRSESFIKNVINSKPQGMKVRARYDFIKNFLIPLPSIDIQRQLVEKYNQQIQKANSYENAENYLLSNTIVSQLSVNEYAQVDAREMFGFIKFSELTRWDLLGGESYAKSNLYKTVSFARVLIDKPKYGANVKGVKKHSDTRYVRITDINEDGTLNDEFVSPEFVDEQYLLEENDFLIARSGNTVGKTFLYKSKLGRAIYAGYLVKYKLNEQMVLPEYVLYYTKSSIFKHWISKNQRVSGQPNINGQEYLSFPLVLPPLDKQMEIVQLANNVARKTISAKQQAQLLRTKAATDFENAVFN